MNPQEVIRGVSHIQWDKGRSLRALTSFGIGGKADLFVVVNNTNSLMKLMNRLEETDLNLTILGGGTDVLISDSGVSGVTLKLGRFFNYHKVLSKQGDCTFVEVGAGTALPEFHRWAWKSGLGGTACLTGIPGTVGGALAVNAGSKTKAIGDLVARVGMVTQEGELVEVPAEGMRFGYRHAGVPDGWVIVYAILCLTDGIMAEERKERQQLVSHRLSTQPHGAKCAGSFFKNPDPVRGPFAGALIERAGLKGRKHGGAMVSKVHANFLINQGWATAQDVLELARSVANRIKADFGVTLEPEVRFIGKGLLWRAKE